MQTVINAPPTPPRKHGDLMLSGKSGEKYCFQVWPLRTRFRPVGAVFFVTRRVFNNKTFRRASHEVLYAGQTACMADDPLGVTARAESFEKLGADCVCVFPTSDEAQRTRMFEDLTGERGVSLVL